MQRVLLAPEPAARESIAKGRDHHPRRPPGETRGGLNPEKWDPGVPTGDEDEDESNNNMVDVMFPRNAHNHAVPSAAPATAAHSAAHQVMTRGAAAYLPPHPAHHAQPPFSHFGHHFHHPGHLGHLGGHLELPGHQSNHDQSQQYQVPPNAHVGSSQPQRAPPPQPQPQAVVHHLPQSQLVTPGNSWSQPGNNKYKNKLFNARQEDRINYHRTRRATGGGGGEEEDRAGGGNEAALAAAAAATAAAAASANKSHAAPRPRHLSVASEVRRGEMWSNVSACTCSFGSGRCFGFSRLRTC